MATIQAGFNFLYYLWRGQVSPAFTYWVVGFFGNLTVFSVPLFIFDSLHDELNRWHIIHLAVSLIYFLCSAVCVGRTLDNPRPRRPKTWPF